MEYFFGCMILLNECVLYQLIDEGFCYYYIVVGFSYVLLDMDELFCYMGFDIFFFCFYYYI